MLPVNRDLLDILVAPGGGSLTVVGEVEEDGQLVSGTLVSDTEERFPIDCGVPRMSQIAHVVAPLDVVATRQRFEAKWAKYGQSDKDKLAEFQYRWFDQRFGFDDEQAFARFLAGRRRVLDAGTGPGLCADRCARLSDARVVGMDLGDSVTEAHRVYGGRANLDFVQGDIHHPPFREGTFDFVVCDQVLHHTHDARRGFLKVAGLLAPGGHCAVYVYRQKGMLRELADEHVVGATSRMSVDDCLELSEQLTELGRELSRLNATITLERGVPLLGIEPGEHDVQRLIYWHMLKCFWNDDLGWHQSVMINYDWYCPRYASRHTEDELLGWCKEASLEVDHLDVLESGISLLARRPR